MTTGRQFVKDESGMVMGLTIIMVVVIGVMGAGLLIFVGTDLNTVVEENRVQKAFEVADAGVGAAKRQLSSDAEIDHYNGGTGDIQWSASQGGLTLQDLDGDGDLTDSVNVTIEAVGTDSYKAISEGTYGASRRKIEAIFELTETTGAGSTPAFYSQSDIMLEKRVTINGLSLFSERNITIVDFDVKGPSSADFKASYEGNNTISKDVLNINNSVADELGDWNFEPWNTAGRKGLAGYPSPYNSSGVAFDGVGFAAEGMICGSSSCDQPSHSVADGVYGYDSTTGTKGNNLRFAEKINCSTGIPEPTREPNGTTCSTPPQNIITYPFERSEPDPVQLKQRAIEWNKYNVGQPSNSRWNTLFDSASANAPKVVFIDGLGTGVDFQSVPEANAYGILVVWCGKLTLKGPFKGVIITLHGDNNELPGNTNCDPGKGGFVSEGQKITGYAYTEGHIGGTPGIHLKENSVLNPFTGPGRDELLGHAFGEGAPTSVETKLTGWRELYE